MIYTINYAYRSSAIATQLGYSKSGCAYLLDTDNRVIYSDFTTRSVLEFVDDHNLELTTDSREWAMRAMGCV